MSLYIQKLISGLLLPLPLCLLLILVGFILAWRLKRTGLILIIIGWTALLTYSLLPVANTLTESLEDHYRPLLVVPRGVNTIVVLGGGVRTNPQVAPANTQLASSSLSRLIEGIRLYRQLRRKNRSARLILSGGSVFNSPQESGILRNTAVMLGVPRSNIVLENGSKNTYQEALYLKRIVRRRPFVLVTSATHMKRAMLIFQSAGMKPIPAPTQFLSSKRWNLKIYSYTPRAKSLTLGDLSLHEHLGILWAKIHNHIN